MSQLRMSKMIMLFCKLRLNYAILVEIGKTCNENIQIISLFIQKDIYYTAEIKTPYSKVEIVTTIMSFLDQLITISIWTWTNYNLHLSFASFDKSARSYLPCLSPEFALFAKPLPCKALINLPWLPTLRARLRERKRHSTEARGGEY